jgi:peptide/nickel transport system ATP-binding protein
MSRRRRLRPGRSRPSAGRWRPARAAPVPGDGPSAAALPSGCRFRLRCPKAAAICAEREPDLAPVAGGHLAACHFPGA